QHRRPGRGEDDGEVGGVLDPEDRVPVEEHVPERAAADGRRDGEHPDAEEVEVPAAGRERAADGEDGHAEEVEYVEEHGGGASAHAGEAEALGRRAGEV